MKALLLLYIALLCTLCYSQEEKEKPTNYSHPAYPYCKALHPERRVDEKFIGNFTQEEFEALSDTTKRKGKVALDENRNPIKVKQIPKQYPVFVKKEKHEEVAIVCPTL